MEEDSILTNPGSRKRSASLYLWWGINIAIVLFVFLAFLFAALAFSKTKELEKHITSSAREGQGGLIANKFQVEKDFNVYKGSVVSYCGGDNMRMCEGLGPVWSRPFTATDSWSPAILASITQVTPQLALYAHVAEADHTALRVSVLHTHTEPSVQKTAVLPLSSPVTFVHARNTSNANVGVIMYTTHNTTYLVAVGVSNDGTGVTFATPLELFPDHDPTQNGTLVRNLHTLGPWILVSFGYWNKGAQFRVFTVNSSPPLTGTGLSEILTLPAWTYGIQIEGPLSTAHLRVAGNDYIIQGTANRIAYGHVDFQHNTIAAVAHQDTFVYFYNLHITPLGGDLVLFSGAQVEFVDEPLVVSMLVQYNATALHVHGPTNLLATQGHRLVGDQLSVCHAPPNDQEPYGGLFFSYIDQYSKRAKILRARPVFYGFDAHILPSPSLDISSHAYGRYGSWLAPHLSCPIATSDRHVLIVVQDFLSTFNLFFWAGGYRYAGIAQGDAHAGQTTEVIRSGISASHNGLMPGYHYYLYNDGRLMPGTSIAELFTPNGFPWIIGTAISNNHLHLENEIFDTIFNN